jgi:hypothetical protein
VNDPATAGQSHLAIDWDPLPAFTTVGLLLGQLHGPARRLAHGHASAGKVPVTTEGPSAKCFDDSRGEHVISPFTTRLAPIETMSNKIETCRPSECSSIFARDDYSGKRGCFPESKCAGGLARVR